ncbi:hypothetical protein T492DRAFT_412466 [Pavlovales sp. CCMP2436]|nr:hypothetical protein T492DRAFT_412466 [Pavlovales sp. CCMP2436]
MSTLTTMSTLSMPSGAEVQLSGSKGVVTYVVPPSRDACRTVQQIWVSAVGASFRTFTGNPEDDDDYSKLIRKAHEAHEGDAKRLGWPILQLADIERLLYPFGPMDGEPRPSPRPRPRPRPRQRPPPPSYEAERREGRGEPERSEYEGRFGEGRRFNESSRYRDDERRRPEPTPFHERGPYPYEGRFCEGRRLDEPGRYCDDERRRADPTPFHERGLHEGRFGEGRRFDESSRYRDDERRRADPTPFHERHSSPDASRYAGEGEAAVQRPVKPPPPPPSAPPPPPPSKDPPGPRIPPAPCAPSRAYTSLVVARLAPTRFGPKARPVAAGAAVGGEQHTWQLVGLQLPPPQTTAQLLPPLQTQTAHQPPPPQPHAGSLPVAAFDKSRLAPRVESAPDVLSRLGKPVAPREVAGCFDKSRLGVGVAGRAVSPAPNFAGVAAGAAWAPALGATRPGTNRARTTTDTLASASICRHVGGGRRQRACAH